MKDSLLTLGLAIGLSAFVLVRRPPQGSAPRRRVRSGRGPSRDGWAGRRELKVLLGTGAGRLRLGALTGRTWWRDRVVRTEPGQSLIVVGPTQSGKTSALAVPAILEWEGPLLAVSVKSDLLVDTEAWRRSKGAVWCFDPAGETGRASSGWSPLRAAATWEGARRVASDLTEVVRTAATTSDGEFWYATAAKLLAPLLFAASTSGATMIDVLRWVDTQEVAEVFELLEQTGVPQALWAVQASWQRDERQRSSVYTTAETVLEPFASMRCGVEGESVISAETLLEGPNTLYLCAPAHDQRRLRGLFVALVKEVVEAGFAMATRSGPLDPPLLVVLDEAANIAPVSELDGLVATCSGHGIQLLTIWQDLAQIAARYGARAPTVLNNHRARLFLSGIAEASTLEQASMLAGEVDMSSGSVTIDRGGSRSVTTSSLRRRLLPPEEVRQLPDRTALLIYGERPPARLNLVAWWADPFLVARSRWNGDVPVSPVTTWWHWIRQCCQPTRRVRRLVSSWWLMIRTKSKRMKRN